MTAIDGRNPALGSTLHAWTRHPVEPTQVCARCGKRRDPRTEAEACAPMTGTARPQVDYDPLN